MAKEATKKKATSDDIHEDVIKVAKSAKKKGSFRDGVLNLDSNDKLLKDNLPEGMSLKSVREVQRVIHSAASGVLKAAGEMALKEFESDKNLKTVTTEPVKLGYDSVSYTITRERPSRNPDTGVEFTKYGSVRTHYKSRITRQSGEMGKVKSHLNNLYREALGE